MKISELFIIVIQRQNNVSWNVKKLLLDPDVKKKKSKKPEDRGVTPVTFLRDILMSHIHFR